MTKTTSAEGFAYRVKLTEGANMREQPSKVKQMYRKGKTVNAIGQFELSPQSNLNQRTRVKLMAYVINDVNTKA